VTITSQVGSYPGRIKTFTVAEILQSRWDFYCSTHPVEDHVNIEVKKALACRSGENGVFLCRCEDCGALVYQMLGCNSRLCSICGKRYTDQWSKSLSKAMFKVPHRHIVMSIPSHLWPYLLSDKALWKVYMDSAIDTINDYMPNIMHRNIKAGVIVVLHPFGKDMKFQPHLHIIMTEGGFDAQGNFHKRDFIPARPFARKWQYHVSKNLQAAGLQNELFTELYKRYDGFYVWVHRAGRIENPKHIAKYIGRYVRHPAIANSRITDFDGENVKFYYREYRDFKETFHDVEMPVDDFISALIQHVPPRQFKMIRYYGAYARRAKKFFACHAVQSGIENSVQVSLKHFDRKLIPHCPICGGLLKPIAFFRIPPPGDFFHVDVKKEQIVRWEIVN
jgi:hypothetical protein